MPFELEDLNRKLSESELIADMQRVASKLGKQSITHAEQNEFGSISSRTITRRLGGWPVALEKAGLENGRIHLNVSKEELFRNLEEVWTRLGRQPRRLETIEPLSKYHGGTYERRFGSWRKALEAFVAYVNEGAASEPDLSTTVSEFPKAIRERGPRKPGRKLQIQVLIRDRGICQLCRREITADGYHIDHIKPWIKDGPTVLENLQLLCTKCNLLKGNLELTEATVG